jgi:hypothetical protein
MLAYVLTQIISPSSPFLLYSALRLVLPPAKESQKVPAPEGFPEFFLIRLFRDQSHDSGNQAVVGLAPAMSFS